MEHIMESLKNERSLKGLETGTDPLPASQQEYMQIKCDMYNAAPGDLNLRDGINCDRCKNRGHFWIVTKNELFGCYAETQIPCRCEKTRNVIRKLNKAGLQNVVRDYTFDKYKTPDKWQESVKQKAMRFCQDDQTRWFFIGGQSGAGKSHLATAIAVHYIKQGMDVEYMQWLEDIKRIKSFTMDGEEYEKLMNKFKEAPVLYIDDLFKEGNGVGTDDKPFTQTDVRCTFEIINYRYNNPQFVTIISSEKTIPDMVSIDEAFAGRIAERTQAAGYCINLGRDIKKNWRLKGMVTL